ncbi:MAG TPA: penicillin acylase family protein [Kofleriaceae bacterium]
MVQISQPTVFTATIARSTKDVQVVWRFEGSGMLSNDTGFNVTFTPARGTSTVRLVATTGDLTAEVTIEVSPMMLTDAVIPGLTAPVSVQSDAHDIPHIRCATANDCFAVQGFLQARDRLFPMDFTRHVARSNLAELIGPDGLTQDVMIRTLFITRAGHRLEDDLTRALDDQTRASLTAFVGGINAFLAQLRATPNARLPGEYQQLPFPITPADIADWSLEDTIALVRLFQFRLSEGVTEESENGQFAAVYGSGPLADPGKLNAWIRAAAPPSEQAHTLAPTPFTPTSAAAAPGPGDDLGPWRGALGDVAKRAAVLREKLRDLGANIGSNNWVISAAASATGTSMVANDPHLTLQYPPQFHLIGMQSTDPADHLNLVGGAFPGTPGAQVGRGAHVGWGVTVTGYDVTDLYLEQFLPRSSCPMDAPCVLFQGAPVSTLPVPQTFLVRVGPGGAVVDASTLALPTPPPAAVLVVPQHGPVIQAPDATGRAISARWTGQEGNTQDLRAFLGLNTATDVDGAIAALRDYATGAQNFVLADDQGHIAYDPHALVPVRQFADVRVRGAAVIPPWFPVPGDGTAEWGDGSSACASATETPVPASCWLADSELPRGKDPAKGYFFTANSDPTFPSVSDDNNPLAHPPYLSFDWDDSTGFRATRIDQLIAGAIADHGRVSLADMEAIQSDHVSRPGILFAGIIDSIATYDASSPAELTVAKNVFARWAANGFDCPSGLTGIDPVACPIDPNTAVIEASTGCFLFHAFLRQLITNVFTDDLRVAGQTVDDVSVIKAIVFMLSLPPGDPGARFCDDVDSTGQVVATHTCMQQVVIALVGAVDALSASLGAQPSNWVWGRVHTLTLHSIAPTVTTGFSPGPFARPGGSFTVDVGNPSLHVAGLAFPYTSGSQVRHISVMDPAAPIVKMQLPGPERDVPAVRLDPLLAMYLVNQYFDFAFGDQIDSVAVSTQIFTSQQ